MPSASFSSLFSLSGGALIGLGATLLWVGARQRAGISSILAGLARPGWSGASWRWQFLAGMISGGLVAAFVHPQSLGGPAHSLGLTAAGAFIAGFGARWGGGCTSGHGVVGVSSGSARSIVATAVFIGVGALVATLVGKLGVW